MNLKEEYEQETERSPVYQIQPHDAGFKMPSLGYIKWLEEKLQTPQPEGVKPDVSEYSKRHPKSVPILRWILDDIEFGYDAEAIGNKIKNGCYQ